MFQTHENNTWQGCFGLATASQRINKGCRKQEAVGIVIDTLQIFSFSTSLIVHSMQGYHTDAYLIKIHSFRVSTTWIFLCTNLSTSVNPFSLEIPISLLLTACHTFLTILVLMFFSLLNTYVQDNVLML